MNYSFCNYIAFAQKSAPNFNPEKINNFFFFGLQTQIKTESKKALTFEGINLMIICEFVYGI